VTIWHFVEDKTIDTAEKSMAAMGWGGRLEKDEQGEDRRLMFMKILHATL
jgi:hypothetical protein